MSYELSQEATSFLMHSYFGITLAELENGNKDTVIMKCAQRAYLDLSRTLEFTNKITTSMNISKQEKVQNEHQDFRDKICTVIKDQILDKLLKSDEMNTSFDDIHKQACENIIEEAKNSPALSEKKNAKEPQKFYYGQAQKWLNMTIKYMWLTGLWKDEFGRLLPKIHIPVDSFIIEAIWHEDFNEDNKGKIEDYSIEKLSVTLPCENKKRQYKYASDKVTSWSIWSYEEYSKFQTSLREWCERNNICPLLWEGQAWIKIANKRSSL